MAKLFLEIEMKVEVIATPFVVKGNQNVKSFLDKMSHLLNQILIDPSIEHHLIVLPIAAILDMCFIEKQRQNSALVYPARDRIKFKNSNIIFNGAKL
jgi:hypothetical protein